MGARREVVIGPDEDQARDAEAEHEELAAERGLVAGWFVGVGGWWLVVGYWWLVVGVGKGATCASAECSFMGFAAFGNFAARA